MAQKLASIRGAWVANESTFGTDPSADGSGYEFINAEFDLPVWSYEQIETDLQSESPVGSAPIAGAQTGEFTLRIPLRAANDATAPRLGEAAKILRAVFGSETSPADTTVGAGATTTVVPVTSATLYRRGMFVSIGVSGTQYLRLVTGVSGNTLTVYPALPGAPAAAQNVYAPTLYRFVYPWVVQSLAFAFRFNADTPVTFLGCKVNSAKLVGLAAGQRAMLEVAFSADSWVTSGKGSLPVSTDRFPTARSTLVKGSPFYYGPYNSGTNDYTLASKVIAGLEVDFGVEATFVPTTEGVQGRGGIEVPQVMSKMSVEGYYASDHLTDVGAETQIGVALGVGVPGVSPHLGSWGVAFNRARVTGAPTTDRNGILGQTLEIQAVEAGADDPVVFSIF